MGFREPQAFLSKLGWVEGDGPSSSKKCLLDWDASRYRQIIRVEWVVESSVITIAVMWKAKFLNDRT